MPRLERGPEMGDLPADLEVFFRRKLFGPALHHEEIIIERMSEPVTAALLIDRDEKGLIRLVLTLKDQIILIFIPLRASIRHRVEHSSDPTLGK